MLYGNEFLFGRHQNRPTLPHLNFDILIKVHSSKFIGRTFLLGNYNTLQLYPSDNILHYNKRV